MCTKSTYRKYNSDSCNPISNQFVLYISALYSIAAITCSCHDPCPCLFYVKPKSPPNMFMLLFLHLRVLVYIRGSFWIKLTVRIRVNTIVISHHHHSLIRYGILLLLSTFLPPSQLTNWMVVANNIRLRQRIAGQCQAAFLSSSKHCK
jgi:hypothetical protein